MYSHRVNNYNMAYLLDESLLRCWNININQLTALEHSHPPLKLFLSDSMILKTKSHRPAHRPAQSQF